MSKLNIPILMYHRIGERLSNSIVRDQYVSPSLFEKQLKALKQKGYTAINLTEMRKRFQADGESAGILEDTTRPDSEKLVVISFDDGYQSFYASALPVLKKYGMTATVFLVANCVGRTNRWDEAKGDVSEPLMPGSEIMEAHKAGIEFGAHTLTHPDLRFCDDELASEEILGSKRNLEQSLGFSVDWFSYPYGKHGERERRLVQQAGFYGACGTEKHTNNAQTDPYVLGRVNVRATSSPFYLLHKLRKVSGKHA